MKTITNQKDFPTNPHYAIMIFETRNIYHEGDERSRTNPGHGYPAYTETVNNLSYMAFDKNDIGKQEWETKIKNLYKEDPKRTDVVAFEAHGKAQITTDVKIINVDDCIHEYKSMDRFKSQGQFQCAICKHITTL